MTQDEIIEMAKQADMLYRENVDELHSYLTDGVYLEDLEAFAKLVAAKEREACAKVCEAGINNATDWDSSFWDQACENRAQAIRARGQE